MGRNAVTSSDVARHANVSQSAVSRAFTAGASVAPATRARIMQAASDLGYRPNALARAMISGRSKLIALVTPHFDNYFYAPAMQRLSREIQERGYTNLLFMSDNNDTEDIVQRILQYQVDGIIVSGVSLSSSQADLCAKTGIPVVLFNRYSISLPASCVVSDNRKGGKLVAEYLVKGGHERIAYIAGEENSSTNRDRETGFTEELKKHNVTLFDREVGSFTHDGAVEAARKLFTGDSIPDAVFVASDQMAFAVMDVLRCELDLSIPEQVSVVGFDDTAPSAWGAYNLTTVAQSLDKMMGLTVDTLLQQIEAESLQPQSIVVPVKLTERGSARTPR